jgi:hypothetical protein
MIGLVDGTELKRTLVSLPELSLRVDWLRERFQRASVPDLARALDELCELSEASDPSAREALLPVALLVIELGTSSTLNELRQHAERCRLLSLARLLRRPSGSLPPEGITPEAKVPDYGAGRELTLGERRNLARRARRETLDRFLSDPHPKVIAELLWNPKLTEDDVVRLAARRPARLAALRELGRSVRWLSRSRVRLALLFNPGTPAELSVPLVGLCTRSELTELVQSADTPLLLRATALEMLERRPPLEKAASESALH